VICRKTLALTMHPSTPRSFSSPNLLHYTDLYPGRWQSPILHYFESKHLSGGATDRSVR